MQHRIALKKVTFLHHLMNLPTNSLAFQIASSQARLDYPGLIPECNIILEFYGITGNPTDYSRAQWKTICRKKIFEKNKNEILEMSKKYRKISHEVLKNEKFETKSYLKEMSLSDARLKFALRTRMTRSIQTNFKGDPTFARNKWRCVGCGEIDSQEHVVICREYEGLRRGKNMNSDEDIVKYFREVISLRES